MIVVSNTSPINYLVLIQQTELLFNLFERIMIPEAVYEELLDIEAPLAVRNWLTHPPDWLHVRAVGQESGTFVDGLDPGEQEAILLAQELGADLLLLDDTKARRAAVEKGLAITGLLGILDQAAVMNYVDLPSAIQDLRATSFWASEHLLQRLIDKWS